MIILMVSEGSGFNFQSNDGDRITLVGSMESADVFMKSLKKDRVDIIVFNDSVITEGSWQSYFVSRLLSLQKSCVLLKFTSGVFESILTMNANDQIKSIKDIACAIRKKAKQEDKLINKVLNPSQRMHDNPYAGPN